VVLYFSRLLVAQNTLIHSYRITVRILFKETLRMIYEGRFESQSFYSQQQQKDTPFLVSIDTHLIECVI